MPLQSWAGSRLTSFGLISHLERQYYTVLPSSSIFSVISSLSIARPMASSEASHRHSIIGFVRRRERERERERGEREGDPINFDVNIERTVFSFFSYSVCHQSTMSTLDRSMRAHYIFVLVLYFLLVTLAYFKQVIKFVSKVRGQLCDSRK